MIAASLMMGLYAWAQSPQAEFEDSLADSVKYVLPEFGVGRVVYNNGEYSNGRFNISTLDQSLRYIGEGGKIMALTENDSVDRVTIGGMMFFRHNSTYVGVVRSVENVLLCSSRRMVFDDAKTGAYGMKSSTTSISQIGRVETGAGTLLNLNKASDYEIKVTPYIYRNNRFYGPTKKVLLKSFPDKAAQIEEYLNANDVNFSKLKDLEALFEAIDKMN